MAPKKNFKKTSLTAISLAASIFLIGIFLYQNPTRFSVNATNPPVSPATLTAPVYVFAKTGEGSTSPSLSPTTNLEVHIANNGDLLLRGARVVSVENGILHVSTAWNLVTFNWEIQSKYSTKFLTTGGRKGNLANIQIGDTLTINGKLIQGGTEPIITAEYIRQ